jgi:hypothetical protein
MMKITRQIVADKITDYLHGKLSQLSWSIGLRRR